MTVFEKPRRTLSGRVVALDIVGDVVRALEARPSGDRLEVLKLAEGKLPGPREEVGAEEVGSALGEILRGARFSARQAALALPRGLAILKPLALPPMEPTELPAAINLQAERELPFPPAEAHIDYLPTALAVPLEGTPAEGGEATGTGVLLGAVQQEVVERYRQVVSAAGLNLQWLGLRPASLVNALILAGVEPSPQFIALLDLDEENAEVVVVWEGRLVFARSVRVGTLIGGVDEESPQGPEGADEIDLSPFRRRREALIAEVRRSLEAFAVQPGGGTVSMIYLTGAGVDEAGLVQAITDHLQVPVEVADAFKGVDLDGRLLREWGSRLSAFSAALGTAASVCAPRTPVFDFLTPISQQLRRPRERRPALLAALGLTLLAALIAVPTWTFARHRARLNRLEDRLAKLRKREKVVRALERRLADLAPWTDPTERVSWYEVYEALQGLWPKGQRAYLTSLSFRSLRGRSRGSHQVVLVGKAQNPGVVEEITNALRSDPRFGTPEFSHQRETSDKLGYPTTFKITVEWLGSRGRKRSAKPPRAPAGATPDDPTGETPSPLERGGRPAGGRLPGDGPLGGAHLEAD